MRLIPQNLTSSRSFRIVGGLVLTIFLGAIGSGLWQLFLSRLVNLFAGFVLATTSSLFHGYVDILYKNVSKNPSEQLAVLPYSAILVFAIVSPWVGIRFLLTLQNRLLKKTKSLDDEDTDKLTPANSQEAAKLSRRFTIGLLIPLALLSTILYLEAYIESFHSRKAALFIDRSIEIVAPHIHESERLKLRAQFRSVEKAVDFYRLEDRLRSIAMQYSIKLPNFQSIR